ncbi:MAG TPA: DUF2975 domain-containing protein [Prolixibacteraceae bacterium]|nr:DUF2975 domain-containing protein [Prolixibacteraceae bacterium]
MCKKNALKMWVAFASIAFGILLGTNLINEFEDFKMGAVMGFAEGNKELSKEKLPPDVYYLKVAPRTSVFNFSETTLNLKNGQAINYRNHQFKVAIPATLEIPKKVKNFEKFQTFLALAVAAFYVVILFKFVNVMRSLQKEVIFDAKNINKIRQIGYFLIANYCLMLVYNHLSFTINKQMFEFSEYIIVREKTNAIILFLGTLILIVAEVIKQGNQFKAEHDLTI